MQFDLYFAGGPHKGVLDYVMEELNAPKLFSPVHEKKEIEEWVEKKRQGITKSKIFIDSGAYTAHTKGTEVDVDAYIAYINDISDAIDVFAQVDKIPGTFGKPRSKEDILDAPKESWENYLYMHDKVKEPHKLIPIFHQDEDFKWLRNMLEWTDKNGNHIPYIGISGAKDKPSSSRFKWYGKVFEVIQSSSNPNVKTHAFGTQIIEHLEQIPFTSADATSWLKTAAYGNIYTPYGLIGLSIQRMKDSSNMLHHDVSIQVLKDYVESKGFNLEELTDDVEGKRTASAQRMMMNAIYFQEWASTYEYKGPKCFKRKGLFNIG